MNTEKNDVKWPHKDCITVTPAGRDGAGVHGLDSYVFMNICLHVYYMVELAIQSVRNITHADWLPGCAISFSHRPVSFGGKISYLI